MKDENIGAPLKKLCSTVELAQALHTKTRTIRYRKNRLKELEHPTFKGYLKGAGLTDAQVNLLRKWQRLSEDGYRGKRLYRELLSPSTANSHVHRINAFAQSNNLSEAVTQCLLTLVETILDEVHCNC
ncbi:MAG: hypothetical protein AAFQ63_15685 [Cyanobacteria bacterium J06621_11]